MWRKGDEISAAVPDDVVDDDGVRVLQQACQFHWNLGKPHARAAKDLHEKNNQKSPDNIWSENKNKRIYFSEKLNRSPQFRLFTWRK